MGSATNQYYERLLALDLCGDEYRLAIALGREVLGYRVTERALGSQRLRDMTSLHGRSFERARAGLVTKGLLVYVAGERGRGKRSTYRLLLENTAQTRAYRTAEKTAPRRANPSGVKDRRNSPEKTAPARGRIGSRGKSSPAGIDNQALVGRAIDAYRGAGGPALYTKDRGALAQQVAKLAKNGTDERLILDAARQLGSRNGFTGLLSQTVTALAANGGACHNEGSDRLKLTPDQLRECACHKCRQYADYLASEKNPARAGQTPDAQTSTPVRGGVA